MSPKQAKGIRLHQYLVDQESDQGVMLLPDSNNMALCQNLSWVVNLNKSKLEPKQVLDFVGYQYDLNQGIIRPTPQRLQSLNEMICLLLRSRLCSVRQFMSLIGLLMPTEKEVPLGRLHMRPIQWQLKRLVYTRIPGEAYPNSNLSPLSSNMVTTGGEHHPGTALASFATPRELYCKRLRVSSRKQVVHKHVRSESRSVGPKGVPASL